LLCSRLFLLRRFTIGLICLAVPLTLLPLVTSAQQPVVSAPPANTTLDFKNREATCRILYVGFVGSLEPAGHQASGIVQIRDILRGPGFQDVCAATFTPFFTSNGLAWILKHFPAHDGVFTAAELQHAPKVIMAGHSAGGWTMLDTARDLRARNIPVELTLQIDSVGFADHTIPKNVSSAAIFHASDILLPLTTHHIRAEDPEHTKVIANILVKNANHLSVTRDPRIRDLVLSTIAALEQAWARPAAKN
jgi:hypothetical protein